jgi:hypothetical protein
MTKKYETHYRYRFHEGADGQGGLWFEAEERNGGLGWFEAFRGNLTYFYCETDSPVRVVLHTDFRPKTMKAFKLRLEHVLIRIANLTPLEGKMPDDATAMRSAIRNTKAKEVAQRRAGKKLVNIPARVLVEDAATIDEIAHRYGREPSFVVRAAIHMFTEAHRKNPGALEL